MNSYITILAALEIEQHAKNGTIPALTDAIIKRIERAEAMHRRGMITETEARSIILDPLTPAEAWTIANETRSA